MRVNDAGAGAARIELFVRDIQQLFHSLDPSPFYDRELDDDARAFIVDSARDLPRDAPLKLVVHVEQKPSLADAGDVVQRVVRAHFVRGAARQRLELRELFRRGRISLAIGLPILVSAAFASRLIAAEDLSTFAYVLRESVLIGGWVAMWRPMEIFLYDWWPIRADERLFERLAATPVEIVHRPV